MGPLHEYVAAQLAERLKRRHVVVWYDPRCEFTEFVDELRVGTSSAHGITAAQVGDLTARLATYSGSFFELRAATEPHMSGESPECLLVYVAGKERDRRGSVLMELETAGECWEPGLKRLALNVLRQRFTDGVIDDLLAPQGVTYNDLARVLSAEPGEEPPSVLKAVFHDVGGSDALLAAWLASDVRDGEVEAKEAKGELLKLVRSRLGLDLPADVGLAKLRGLTLRYVLGSEFRLDLRGPAPASLDAVPAPATKDEQAAVRDLAGRLRTAWAEAYPALADRVEGEFGLTSAKIPGSSLGAIDTFRFEERVLLDHCGALIAAGKFDEAQQVVTEREQSFWLVRDVERRAQWEACRRMAELGRAATSVRAEVTKAGGDAGAWVAAYTAPDGWHRMDQAQRRLESWLVSLEDDPDERPLGVVRRAYEDACHAMAEGFTRRLAKAGWVAAPSVLAQTHVYVDVVSRSPRPVAFLLVDALRYEMGVELAGRLPGDAEVSARHAIAALPSITKVGMAALQPSAAASFAVVEQAGKLGARIEDAFLPDLAARQRFAAARVPTLVDMSLDDLLTTPPKKLEKRLEGAQVVVIRSQEIDSAGEGGFAFQARRAMDTVIDNLARAIKKLSAAGIEHTVVTADHGHLFFAADRDESMRIDAPNGERVELHRRCWIGRGGSTPSGCVRVAASALGYDSDLDFVFPAGAGVFRAGGDLAYHHGGPSLQELVVPVLTVRLAGRKASAPAASVLTVTGLPDAVTNRIFTVGLQLGGANLSLFGGGMNVRPLLVADGKEVGSVGMVLGGAFDRETGTVMLEPNTVASVALILQNEAVGTLRVVVQDPATDAELYRSPIDIPVRLGV